MNNQNLNKYIAEAFGTFVLTFLGCASCLSNNTLGIAVAFGLSVVAMAYTIGSISGCHINPAITIGCFLTGRISKEDAIGYIAGQVVGGLVAGLFLLIFFEKNMPGLGANTVLAGCAGNKGTALFIEVVLTFLFVFVVLGVTSKMNNENAKFAGLAIGFTLILIHLVGIPFTGTSVNPARSIGPALFSKGINALENVWIFIIGPAIGAAGAAFAWKYFEKSEKK